VADKVPAHKHQLYLATAPRSPSDPNHRDLMACSFDHCIYTEIVCADCVREGRDKSILGFHSHAADGTITRASYWPGVKPIRPPGFLAPPKVTKPRAKKA
jgi:hypothetical protein